MPQFKRRFYSNIIFYTVGIRRHGLSRYIISLYNCAIYTGHLY